MVYDLLIKNALIIDGTGEKGYKGDVGIINDRIKSVGETTGKAKKVIDATGKYLCPGFIDSHSHSDLSIPVNPTNSFKLEQGVTTEITGQCGLSLFPVSKDNFDEFNNTPITDMTEFDSSFNVREMTSAKKWFNYVDNLNVGTNMSILVGHGAIRAAVMGYSSREAANEELNKMETLLREAMETGALGMSSGLAYAPGIFASAKELEKLVSVVAEYNGIYATHMKNQGAYLLNSVKTTIELARKFDCKTVISHLKCIGKPNWGKAKEVAKMIKNAREDGVRIACDFYPYLAGATTLKVTLPPSVLEGGVDKLIERLKTKEYRDYVRKQINNPTEEWENVIGNNGFESILVAKASRTPDAEGKTLKEYADSINKDCFEAYFDLFVKNGVESDVQTINFVMDEEDLLSVMNIENCMVGTDSMIMRAGEFVHPRAIGAFPRFIGRYVRDKKIMSIETAIKNITGYPADFYGINSKGYIKNGYDADILIFDYNSIIDNADFTDCYKPNDGIEYVIINGKIAVEQGKYNGVTNGQIMRHKGTKI